MPDNGASDNRPTNADPGIYHVRVRDLAGDRTLRIEGPSLAAVVAALGGRVRDGGPVLWGGIIYDPAGIEPDITVIPL